MKLTNAEGQVVATYTYGTYGELLSGDTSLTHFLYNGRCGVSTDANGLYYMRQRYYNPEIKRFVNQDILTGSLSNSQSLNQYSYVQGNPVSYTDPFGLSPVNGLFSDSNNVHGALTLLGFAPGPAGALADLADALLYLVEGDVAQAAWALVAIGCSSVALVGKMAKPGKNLAKAGKLSRTATHVEDAADLISDSASFMKAAPAGQDTNKLIKSIKQSRVGEKLKDVTTAVGNKLNAKNLSKLDLDTQIRIASEGATTHTGGLRYNIQFFAESSTSGKGVKKAVGKSGSNYVQIEGRGTTGRTTPCDLIEEMVMDNTMKNPFDPGEGNSVSKIIDSLNDERWKGWEK